MYGVLYSVGGKLGIVDTTDGVIEQVDKDKAISWVKDLGLDIKGIANFNGSVSVNAVIVDMAYQLFNYGENNANIFSAWTNVIFSDKHVQRNTQDPEGNFSFKVKKNGKNKDYKGSFMFMRDCSTYGVSGQGVVLKFSNNLRTVVPFNMIRPYISAV